MMQNSQALTIAEATQSLRISRAGIYRLFSAGELPFAKVGGRTLVRRQDIDALLERSLVVTPKPAHGT